MKLVSGIAALALAAGLAQGAGPTFTIDFDKDSAGVNIPNGSTIANQYLGWGVKFTPNAYSGGTWATNTDMTATSTDVGGGYTAVHKQVLHSFGGWLNEDNDPSIRVDFASPIDSLSVTFIGDFDNLSEVDLFDGSGNFITFGLVSGSGSDKVVSFTGLSGLGVVSIGAILPGWFGDWVGVDDIKFSYVPAPASVGLLGLGALVAGRRRR